MGAFHMATPGVDLHHMKVDDVLWALAANSLKNVVSSPDEVLAASSMYAGRAVLAANLVRTHSIVLIE